MKRTLLMAVVLAGCNRPLPAPAAVELVSPDEGVTLRSARVAFSWLADGLAARYVLQVSATGDFATVLYEDTLTLTGCTCTLVSDGRSHWRVRAVSADGVAGEWSETRQFTLERFRIEANCPTAGYAHAVAVAGSLACVADGQAGLVLVDVSDPAAPVVRGSVRDSQNEAWGVGVRDTFAYVAFGYNELKVVNIARPDSPFGLGDLSYPQPGFGYDVAVRDTLVYIAADAQFIVASVADPRYPNLVFQRNYPRSCRDVLVDGSRCYVVGEQLGLDVWRADTVPPLQLGNLDTPGNSRGVAARGNRAFVADGREGLAVIDVSDPAAMREVARITLDGYATSVALRDTVAFIACGGGGVSIVRVTEPDSPQLVATLTTPYAAGVCAYGDRVLLADRDLGLAVIRQEE